ncbi:MAG: hypothetical protein RMN24_00700 [Anaerolineae bacterium]|nr:hypothetical protein [Anaerolineae bacterium]
MSKHPPILQAIARDFGYRDVNELLVAIADGDVLLWHYEDDSYLEALERGDLPEHVLDSLRRAVRRSYVLKNMP